LRLCHTKSVVGPPYVEVTFDMPHNANVDDAANERLFEGIDRINQKEF